MNVKLTKRKAWELISRIHPRLNIKQEATPPDVAIFKASTGPEGLEIRCENDWFNHNGRIKLTISNVDGGTPIVRYEKKSQAKLSPTDAELENGQNWTLVHSGETTASQRTYINHKAIPIARIQSLG